MNRFATAVVLAAVLVPLALVPTAQAGTIIKLGFGNDSLPDIELSDGKLSTFDDGAGATDGDQNTEVTFLGALSGITAPEGDRSSFTLDNVMLDGNATVIGSTALQSTTGGTFALYDPSNNLLLSGTLGSGTISGPVTNNATAGFLTAEFGSFTGGSLRSTLLDAGIGFSSFAIALTDVNDGQGLRVDPQTNQLGNFTADATANVSGQVPEPTGLIAVLLGAFMVLPRLRARV